MKTFDLTVTDIETGTITRITVISDPPQGVGLRIGRATWVLSRPDAEVLADALCAGIRTEALALSERFEALGVLLKRKCGMSLDQFFRKLEQEPGPAVTAEPLAPKEALEELHEAALKEKEPDPDAIKTN